MAWAVTVNIFTDILEMAGAKTDRRIRVVLVKLAQVKGTSRKPKDLFLSYCEKALLIQFTWLDSLRAWPKIEGLSGVMVEKLHDVE